MNKVEKYIDFIINDLVRNTDIDYEKELIVFPFLQTGSYVINKHVIIYLEQRIVNYDFSNYVMKRYGCNRDETTSVWDVYTERIKNRIETRIKVKNRGI